MLDGQAVVRERCENSNIATYFTSARGIEYRRDDTAEDPGNPSRHVVRWYLYDGLGSVIAEVGEEVLMEADNTPCVPVLGVNRLDVYGNDLGGSSSTSSHKFVGKLGHTTDSNTGLIYMRARYYDPGLGRFISEDPAQDGVNWFVYCRNNPTNLMDLTGKFAVHAIILVSAFLIGGYVNGWSSGQWDWGDFVIGGIASAAATDAALFGGPYLASAAAQIGIKLGAMLASGIAGGLGSGIAGGVVAAAQGRNILLYALLGAGSGALGGAFGGTGSVDEVLFSIVGGGYSTASGSFAGSVAEF